MPRSAFYVLFTASGFAGLIYESIWTHYLKLFLGHAAYAQSLVLVVFMGGMAAGAAWCARLSERLRNPLLGYAIVEALIGALALAFHPSFVGVTDWAYASLLPALASEWAVLGARVSVACLLILPQSVLLGMTFPLMSAGLARAQPAAQGESISMLYFTNSLGAAAGVLASGFVLIAWVGLPGTLRTAGLLNFVLAAAVWLLARPVGHAALKVAGERSGHRLLLLVALLTGLASFVYEIVWIRMLSLVLGASTHSFELMLSTFILGLALGGLAVRRHVDRSRSPERLLAWVQITMGLGALATLPLYNWTFDLMEALMRGLARTDAGYFFFNLAGQAVAALVMLPATFFAGMTLPLITGALLRAGAGERAIGQVYAANTLGAIAGVLLAVHVGLPLLGIKGALLAGCAIDIGLGLLLFALFAPRPVLIWSGSASAAALLLVALAVQLDANKMTAGVFRHGELESSREARVLFARDGKTATVHLAKYDEMLSLRTNGKSDGSINMDADGPRGSDEITMVLTGALPLALKPEAKTAAVIGIGTGLTTHTLLQSLSIEQVDTVEIEAAMAQAARGFMPRNSSAFADPRGAIRIDDAKTYFSSARRRYDIIISEPSNPWVSGVSSLFTREFYQRIRSHLNPGGLLVQWIQLYEIDASLVATILAALGEEFPHYAVYAASDHDLLVVAGERPVPAAAQPAVFEHPALAKELWTVHTYSAGDFDGRYLGSRATLEPLFASYGMPANSDYAPVLDLNAARHRFTEKSADDIVALLNEDVPVLELLEASRSRRPPNPLYKGAYAFERFENTRLAWYARDFLVSPRTPQPESVPTQLQKDLELIKLRLLECREPRELDVWLHSAARVAGAVNPYLAPDDAGAVWDAILAKWCFATLQEFQQRWLALFRAVARRDARRMAELAAHLLSTQPNLGAEPREYLVRAALAGHIASGDRAAALRLWNEQEGKIRAAERPVFRLLRCHAEPSGCAATFSSFAAY
jgi:spermidine synthase